MSKKSDEYRIVSFCAQTNLFKLIDKGSKRWITKYFIEMNYKEHLFYHLIYIPNKTCKQNKYKYTCINKDVKQTYQSKHPKVNRNK